ncbi:hypothetical protein HAX54_013437 [Datura stramonium]|uniref:Uncharacterized protein n=1 Tax=Datura stramonium TaxID=4076 RepID=A0ABS8RYB2_DATST|nr:hypothetical protein [Datura stramonium]
MKEDKKDMNLNLTKQKKELAGNGRNEAPLHRGRMNIGAKITQIMVTLFRGLSFCLAQAHGRLLNRIKFSTSVPISSTCLRQTEVPRLLFLQGTLSAHKQGHLRKHLAESPSFEYCINKGIVAREYPFVVGCISEKFQRLSIYTAERESLFNGLWCPVVGALAGS